MTSPRTSCCRTPIAQWQRLRQVITNYLATNGLVTGGLAADRLAAEGLATDGLANDGLALVPDDILSPM